MGQAQSFLHHKLVGTKHHENRRSVRVRRRVVCWACWAMPAWNISMVPKTKKVKLTATERTGGGLNLYKLERYWASTPFLIAKGQSMGTT